MKEQSVNIIMMLYEKRYIERELFLILSSVNFYFYLKFNLLLLLFAI
jgi:hypothetical protein